MLGPGPTSTLQASLGLCEGKPLPARLPAPFVLKSGGQGALIGRLAPRPTQLLDSWRTTADSRHPPMRRALLWKDHMCRQRLQSERAQLTDVRSSQQLWHGPGWRSFAEATPEQLGEWISPVVLPPAAAESKDATELDLYRRYTCMSAWPTRFGSQVDFNVFDWGLVRNALSWGPAYRCILLGSLTSDAWLAVSMGVSDVCTLCGQGRGTAMHLFWQCEETKDSRSDIPNPDNLPPLLRRFGWMRSMDDVDVIRHLAACADALWARRHDGR